MPRDRLFLTEALSAMERIMVLAESETAESITADRTKREALLWNFTVLGEAIGQVTIKDEHPEVEWRKPVALRNRIVHAYWSADLDVLLDAAQRSIPEFRHQLALILEQLPDTGSPEV